MKPAPSVSTGGARKGKPFFWPSKCPAFRRGAYRMLSSERVERDELTPATSAGRPPVGTSRASIALALVLVYVVWGSTYLAMRVALGGFPPLLMAGLRFIAGGVALYFALRLRGITSPTPLQWLRGSLVGVLMLTFGNGGVAIAEQWVASGLAAVMIASVPLWAALFNGFFDRWPTGRELLGIAVGTAGVLLLNLGGDFRGQPLGAAVLLAAAASWALGSVWSRR